MIGSKGRVHMGKKGCLAVISGFSGSGKGTLIHSLLEKYDCYRLSVSATTRSPREGEQEGREYFFKSKEAFEEMIRDGALLEHACYVNHYYGTPRDYVMRNLEAGMDVLLEIEIQGALQIRERFPDAVLIFITTPSAQELKNRLLHRGTEDMETIRRRLSRAKEEAESMDCYDYIVVNDEIGRCREEIHGILTAAHARASQQAELIGAIKEDLKQF